jgi:hypothetical protein
MRLRSAVPLLLVGLVATGCGSESTTDTTTNADPAQLVRAASEKTVEAGTSRLSLQVATSTQGLDIDVAGEGVVDNEAGTAELSLTLPGTDSELMIRVVSDALFMSGFPGAPAEQWVKLSPEDLGAESGLGDLQSFTDPTATFDQLQAVADDVKEVGEEDVRGTKTTHYQGTIVLADVLEQAPADQREAMEAQLQPLIDSGVDSLPFDAYLDDEGRLRRMVQKVTLDPAALGGDAAPPPGASAPPASPVEVETTIDVYDFGVEVDVQEPPADQVVDGLEGLEGILGSETAPA